MEPINDLLWEIAKKRSKFKKSVISYAIIIPFLWFVWLFSSGNHDRFFNTDGNFAFHLPWPAWVMIGWGIGLAFQFADAYVFNTKQSIESEYEKLKNRHK
jgi:hypothetical protein